MGAAPFFGGEVNRRGPPPLLKRLSFHLEQAKFVANFLGSLRRSIDRSRDATSRFCQASVAVSGIALAGWAAGLLFLARGLPASGALSPAAALCFLLLALALFNHNRDPLNNRAKAFLVLTAILAPLLLATAEAGRLFELSRPAASGYDGRAWFHWTGADPFTWASLCWLSLLTTFCPLVAGRRRWVGDALGVMGLFLVLVNGIFISGYLHGAPISFFSGGRWTLPFLGCANMVLLGLAVVGRLGPRYFPLRLLAGASVRTIILRHFLPIVGAAVLVLDVLNGASNGSIHLLFSSFLALLLSLVAVIYLSLRSAGVISRRIENSLKESEERYAVLVNSLKDHAVLLLDPDGRIVTWNAGAENIHGYKSEEVLGDSVSLFYPPEERESGRMQETFKRATLLGSYEKQGWRMRKDGSRFWAETVTTPFMDNKETVLGFSQVVRDITRRRKAEEVVKERESFMRLLQTVTAACNGAETLDEALDLVLTHVGRHTQWPVGHAWLPRGKEAEFISGPWYLSDPERFAAFRSHSDRLRFPPDQGLPRQVLASGKPQWTPDLSADKDFPHRREVKEAGLAAGYAFPVKLSGKMLAILVFFSEQPGDPSVPCREAFEAICVQLERVAERERADRSLRNSELRFRSVTQTANDAIVSYNTEGVINGWNRGAKTIFGFKEGEAIGRSLDLIVLEPSSPDSSPARFPRALLTDMGDNTHDLSGRRKGGPIFPIEVSVASWRSRGNTYFTAIMRDVTAHRHAQDNLASSLREKEALLKEIHHRVKNNLQMISSLLRLQAENIHDPDLLAVFLESQNRVRSMAIIHECLYESPDLARMDFSNYVEKLTDNLLRTYSVLPERNSIRLEVDNVSLSLDVAIPCGLIITELVSNALKYAYPKGREGVVSVRFRTLPENRYELSVTDQGVGLKKPINFESTESLGLRLVHILTEQLGGSLLMENGVGAKFTVNFKEPEGATKIDSVGGRP